MKAAFLSPLVTECVDDLAAGGRGIWRVMQPFRYYSAILDRLIEVEPGFLTDYASVPRLPVLYLLFGDTSHKAAVIHDWLYHHHEVCDEATANRVLREASVADGIPAWRSLGIYLGVQIGGAPSWRADGPA
ncbi:DUF1353 domain-containing protein [Rugamonas sp. FT82W]|uniref:DUF1353 domain-containing protein n=1 Tax=Duganella vulcania TaxID=2692166 RepID=A0A845G7H9_9BURK|nr:DUF1353 domain-containing protein [Duganella vulcania]MYM89560.1 DUF1353 domain-containing protein [Duganella vulcania]